MYRKVAGDFAGRGDPLLKGRGVGGHLLLLRLRLHDEKLVVAPVRLQIYVVGHTDGTGPLEANLKLSAKFIALPRPVLPRSALVVSVP